MREVKISLTGWKLADAMGELRKWLDHHNCVPVNFDIERGKRRCSWCGFCLLMTPWPTHSSATLGGR
jgi:hypothetical protein